MSFLNFGFETAHSVGDILHVAAYCALLLSLMTAKSSEGVSGKAQMASLLAYILDFVVNFVASDMMIYDVVVALLVIVLSSATTYCTYVRFRHTYERDEDTFPVRTLMVLTIFVALIACFETTHLQANLLCSLAPALEAVSFVPQFSMSFRKHQVPPVMVFYVLALLGYRSLYAGYFYYGPMSLPHCSSLGTMSALCAIQSLVYLVFISLLRVDGGHSEADDPSLEKTSESQPRADAGTSLGRHTAVIWIRGGGSGPWQTFRRECFGLLGPSGTGEQRVDDLDASDKLLSCPGVAEPEDKVLLTPPPLVPVHGQLKPPKETTTEAHC